MCFPPFESQEGRIEVVNQCLRCKGPCETTVNFCEDCRALLQSRFQHNDQAAHSILLHHTGKAIAVAPKSNEVKTIPTTPLASIQDATTSPRNEGYLTELPTMPISGTMNDLPAEDADLEEDEGHERIEQSDPLLTRHLPDSTEAALIEEQDIQRAATQDETAAKDTQPSPHPQRLATLRPSMLYSGKIPRRLRIALIAFVIVAALALTLDGVLVFLDVTRNPMNIITSKTVSTLTQ